MEHLNVKKTLLIGTFTLASSLASASGLNDLTYSLEMGASNYFIAPSAQYSINNYFRASAAAGIFIEEVSGSVYYDVGILYYPFSRGLRTSLNYGTHVVHEKKTGTKKTVIFNSGGSYAGDDHYSFPTSTGFSLGLGYDWADSQGGWKIDLMYILTSTADNSNELEGFSNSSKTSDEFSTTTITNFSQSSALGPSGSGDAWIKFSYQF